MEVFLSFLITGLVTGAVYALIGSGLVVTYTTTGIFNLAHGAIGMAAAFTYWWLWQDLHLNAILALLILVVGVAPLFGLVIERLLMRALAGAPIDLTLAVTLGLLVFLFGGANVVFNPNTVRTLPQFFTGHGFHIGYVLVSVQDSITFLALVAVAVALWLFFSRTRTGIALRAVVDSPDLLAMAGGRPVRIQQLAWMIGCSLAALGGVLIAQLAILNIVTLTLLVVNGYAAAIIGRLRSLPIAIGGGLAVGVANALQAGYIRSLASVTEMVPLIVLFVALVLLPQDRLRTASFGEPIAPRVASLRSSLGGAAALVIAAIVLSRLLSETNLGFGAQAFAIGLLLLSLVLVTGYGGMISLCQMTIAGVGGIVMADVGGSHGSLLGILAAIGICGAIGAALALPTLRLRGLYFALATFAFAAMMDDYGFPRIFGVGGGKTVARPDIPGISLQSNAAYFVFCAVVFAAAAIALLAMRRGPFGRRLVAMNDSPAACATLGISVNRTKLIAFTASAGLAGLAGALFSAGQVGISANDFASLASLAILLLARIGGINTATGALVGGVFFVLFDAIHAAFPSAVILGQLKYILTGLAAMSIGRDPNGFGGRVEQLANLIRARRRTAVPAPAVGPAVTAGTPAAAFLGHDDELVRAGR